MTTREKLIAAGVRNLREFGYPDCDEKNILADQIYSVFFDRMLADHRGNYAAVSGLRAEIEANTPAKS